ncbi:MAG: DNA-binding domain-containing protein [Vicinamibacterales bacterium]
MLSLAETQQRLRDAVVSDKSGGAADLLVGGLNAAGRLAIHRRHYEASLVAALMGRFPATGWLMGTAPIEDAARVFVHEHPPTAPCIAEYGRDFPKFLTAFLTTRPGIRPVPELRAFSELDWHLGRLAVAVDIPPVTRDQVAAIPAGALADTRLTIQLGTYYFEAARPIDDLMKLYLADAALHQIELPEMDVRVEARGARGVFRFARLTPAEFAFRAAIANAQSVGDSAQNAWNVDESFDPGTAMAGLIDAGLVTDLSLVSALPVRD